MPAAQVAGLNQAPYALHHLNAHRLGWCRYLCRCRPASQYIANCDGGAFAIREQSGLLASFRPTPVEKFGTVFDPNEPFYARLTGRFAMHARPSRVGSRESLAYSKSGPKPGGASCLSAKTAQCLIGLPLVLALFALSLQVRHLHRCLQYHLILAPVNGCKPLCKRYSNTCGSAAHLIYVAAVDHARPIEPETAAHNDRRLCYQVLPGTAW